jgi:hypothetical protein
MVRIPFHDLHSRPCRNALPRVMRHLEGVVDHMEIARSART